MALICAKFSAGLINILKSQNVKQSCGTACYVYTR